METILVSLSVKEPGRDRKKVKIYEIDGADLDYLVGKPLADYFQSRIREEGDPEVEVHLHMQVDNSWKEPTERTIEKQAMDRIEEIRLIAAKRAEEGVMTPEEVTPTDELP